MLFTNLIQSNLTTQRFGRSIEYYTFTDSTKEDVWELVEEGAKEGMVVITDQQKKGKGRRGNIWISEPGSSLTFSFLIQPQLTTDEIGLLSLLMGVAIVDGISKFAQLECQLKWPNDIIIQKKKVGGILAESKTLNNQCWVVMGVGLNVNEQTLPDEISDIATSLRIEKGSPIQREPLLAFILNSFESLYNQSQTNWIDQWNFHCVHLNSDITFHHGPEKIQGVFTGIDEIGQAQIKINGSLKSFPSGIIELK